MAKKKSWLKDRIMDLETTVGGAILGGLTVAGYGLQEGKISKEAIIAGAGVGAVGALMKTPAWAKIFGRSKNAFNPSVDEINRRVGGEPPEQ